MLLPKCQPRKQKPLPAAIAGPMPTSVQLMLPTLASKPFSDSAWLFEPKWDGWRTLCFFRDDKAHLISRRRNSLSERFPELKEISSAIKARAAVLEGEIVALDKNGLPQFDGPRRRHARKLFSSLLRVRSALPRWF